SESYKPRRKAYLRLNPFYNEAESRKALFAVLERTPKQLDALLAYIKLSKSEPDVLKSLILETSGCGPGALKTLIDKEIFIKEDKVVSRLGAGNEDLLENFNLSDSQKIALEQINHNFAEKDVVLLHGITSSGKTQIYIRLIEQALNNGRQVLYL